MTDQDTDCPHGSWPARECDRCEPPESYTAPILVIGAVAALGYVLLGASIVFLGILAWHAARAIVGGGS